MTIRGINTISEETLRGVMQDMLALGAPTIRVIKDGDTFYAIEGTHRLEAARRLNLQPIIVVVADETTAPTIVVRDVYNSRSQTVGQLRATFIECRNEIVPTFVF